MQTDFIWTIIEDTYIFILLFWLLTAIILRNNRHYKLYLTFSAVVYIAVLLYVTLLGRTASSEYRIELSFFWEYRLALQGSVHWFFQIFDNVMLFVPMGWLYGGLRKRTVWWGAVLFGAATSLVIELCQLFSRLGLFEFDDIFNNTVGMMVGYSLYRVITKASKRK